MKRLFRNVNTFGLFGMVIMGLLLFTQSAFKPAESKRSAELIYGYDTSNPSAPWVADGTPGYECVPGTNICQYLFDTPPSNAPGNITPRSEGIPLVPGEDGLGSYQLVD